MHKTLCAALAFRMDCLLKEEIFPTSYYYVTFNNV